MKILVLATDWAWDELVTGNENIEWIRAENISSFTNKINVNCYFNLLDDAISINYSSFQNPVFINSVAVPLQKITVNKNIIRINGWKGFIKRRSWEVSGKMDEKNTAILKALNKNVIPVPDQPGFISARIIAMIINEAYFAKSENVSTEKEIDVAMKLGTNYPYGPFEWASIIGIKNIYALLKILSETDSRYQPSHLIEEEVKNQ